MRSFNTISHSNYIRPGVFLSGPILLRTSGKILYEQYGSSTVIYIYVILSIPKFLSLETLINIFNDRVIPIINRVRRYK